MKPSDVFGIILRSVALWIAIWGAWQMTAAIARLPATVEALFSAAPVGINSVEYFIYGFPAFLAGILILRFADALVGFTYRRPTG
jgi:hypothetical protein